MVKPVEIVESFLQALSEREIGLIMSFFDERSSWQNVPHPPSNGIQEIELMFSPIIRKSSKVQWDILSSAYAENRAWLERVDRFWIAGIEYSVQCNGVFEFDLPRGKIITVRDYVDLGEWRERLALAQLND
tara:strand:- start:22277 stop:22669 length:393 start_codon:yes stop_codon:yes gene_type:complete